MMKMEADDLVAELVILSCVVLFVVLVIVVVGGGCVDKVISVGRVCGLTCSLGSSSQDNNDRYVV